MRRQRAGLPFLALGIAFVALGAGGRRAFFALGVVFIVLGMIMTKRG